jgi:hypothetical protein
MTTLREAKARLFRVLDRKGGGHGLDSFHTHVDLAHDAGDHACRSDIVRAQRRPGRAAPRGRTHLDALDSRASVNA